MKNSFYVAVILAAMLLILPLFSLKDAEALSEDSNSLKPVYSIGNVKAENFRVLMADKKEIKEMSAEDYIVGVVAAEMPALYETEALKAQAVAAYSFACRRKAENKAKDYDISADPALDQSFASTQELKEKWGDKYAEYEDKIRSAVKAVEGQTANYKGEVALTLYHAISCGKTESSKAIWGGKYDYLVSVDSVWDKLSPNYLSTVTVSFAELKEKLGGDFALVDSNDDIKILSKTDTGAVKKLSICSKEISGEDFRKALDLRSLNFTYKIADGKITLHVSGYGHGVGMSQYGADYMAKQGSDYIEILKHYYKGVTVSKATQNK